MKSKKPTEQLKTILKGMGMEFITFFPVMVGLGIMIVSGRLSMLFVLGIFVAGFSGIIIILRKEIPTAFTRVHGTWAVIQGCLLLVLFWGGALIILIEKMNSVP